MAQIADQAAKMRAMPWAHLRLPPFPMVAMRVLQLIHNENMQLHQIEELISSDPAFASEVLTVANSAIYSLRYPVNSILQALSVLGGNALQGMCITVGVRTYLGKSMNQPSMKILWRHNLACALIAQRLAAASGLDRDTAYTAGILHDIGRAALAVIQPREFSALLAQYHGTAESVLEGERALFGWDHCETGLELIKGWKLPSQFADIIADHHQPRNAQAGWNLTELIKMSCRMADVAHFPAFPGCACMPYPELLEQLPEGVARCLPTEAETLAQEVAESVHHVELV